jgi:hypothetical protein
MTDLSPVPTIDPAALFCCAVSLRDAAMESTGGRESNLGEEYNGWDEFLRQVMGGGHKVRDMGHGACGV